MIARALIAGLLLCLATTAQAQILPPNAQLQISEDQKLVFVAEQKMMLKDYQSAENLYTQALAINRNNVEALLQRAATRRELHRDAEMQDDAREVIERASQYIAQAPNNSSMYYKRAMGYRILKQFDAAEADLKRAIALDPNQQTWQQDLKALLLERKIALAGK